MFNLFKKKQETVRIIDKIWMSEAAKHNGILDLCRKDPELVTLCWFDETYQRLTTLFTKETISPASLLIVKEAHIPRRNGKNIIFAEHYPMLKKEQELFKQLQLAEAVVYSAMDEPLFKYFGGDQVIELMKKLGAEENSVIEHKMISSSIKNAQEKIEKKVLAEHSAYSQKEWIERNLTG